MTGNIGPALDKLVADYVIVGSGSAGSAMAYRLAEDGRHRVAVIEAGGSDAGPLIQMPAALSYPMNMARYDWGYSSEPEPQLNHRRLAAPRGRVIGGSSSINGMVYVRGHARDFDHWEAAGAQGWAYADVLPYFKRMEAWEPRGQGGDPDWRGRDGPLSVTRGPMKNPLYRAFIEAGRQAGYETTDDYNGQKGEGLGPFDATIRNGRRWSAANAYLRPAMKRGNVALIRGRAAKVVFEEGRATGVALADGRVVTARAEVVLSASAFNTPQLLMLSGIGPGAHLREMGLPVLADRPGVGGNLQDHLEVYVQYRATQPVTLYGDYNLAGMARTGLVWLLGRGGLGASNHFEAGGFVRSAAGVDYPDIQFHFLPLAVRYDGKSVVRGHGFQIHTGPMRSASVGSVRLRSADPLAAPLIRFNYMSTAQDWRDFRAAIRAVREIVSQPALAPFRGREVQPGPEALTDADIDAFVRDHAESAYHPCGTARMGRRDDPQSVIDGEGRVIGVDGLRVADSSVFPRITYGNLNAPSIMVGEKMADHILGRQPLPRENAEPWINPRWRESDR